eukprot:TRINITY_DN28069_c0_g1_i1.p1 TRINITY_DN28069_c0_g1~~TRINITY_DN28069_c0_g1_i1.p1  ORF type:complete len:152 (+),score=29.60 TRINITY_DN28069_c0_g1_i1:37-492(+)
MDDDEWYRTRRLVLPPVPPFVPPPTPIAQQLSHVDLHNKRLQIIVKLANIILHPDNPSYPGGSWHVEGMFNERIVASGIYYYASHNVSPSRLEFREEVGEPNYAQSDTEGVKIVYGLEDEGDMNQHRGSVLTREDLCISPTSCNTKWRHSP